MVAQQTLTLYVRVRILHPLPNLRNFGSGGFLFFRPLSEMSGQRNGSLNQPNESRPCGRPSLTQVACYDKVSAGDRDCVPASPWVAGPVGSALSLSSFFWTQMRIRKQACPKRDRPVFIRFNPADHACEAAASGRCPDTRRRTGWDRSAGRRPCPAPAAGRWPH